MNLFIKSLEWICDNKSIFKLESINAYLQDLISKERIQTDLGWIDIGIVEKSDIQYVQEEISIIISDNTDYWITYDEESTNIDTISLADVLTRRLDGKGILNSRNYVGILDVGISDFEIVVKSKKMNYERDFNFLRESISEFCDDLLSRSSSYFSEHFEKSDEYVTDEVNYADIAYLRCKLSPDNFPAWVDYFIYHAEHKYIAEEQEKSISEIDEIVPESYMDSLIENQLVRTKKVRGRAGNLEKAPQFVKSVGYQKIPKDVYHLVGEIIVKHIDGTYLLMQRDFCKNYGGMWELTAGGSALQGENPLECAIRELKEETGIKTTDLIELDRMVHEVHQSLYVEFLYIADCNKDVVKLQKDETIAFKWVTRDEILNMQDDIASSRALRMLIDQRF